MKTLLTKLAKFRDDIWWALSPLRFRIQQWRQDLFLPRGFMRVTDDTVIDLREVTQAKVALVWDDRGVRQSEHLILYGRTWVAPADGRPVSRLGVRELIASIPTHRLSDKAWERFKSRCTRFDEYGAD
jgi:hypothetical protein